MNNTNNTVTENLTVTQQLASKLEYRFRKSEAGIALVERINNNTMQDGDAELLVKKLEYNFKKSSKGQALVAEFLQPVAEMPASDVTSNEVEATSAATETPIVTPEPAAETPVVETNNAIDTTVAVSYTQVETSLNTNTAEELKPARSYKMKKERCRVNNKYAKTVMVPEGEFTIEQLAELNGMPTLNCYQKIQKQMLLGMVKVVGKKKMVEGKGKMAFLYSNA